MLGIRFVSQSSKPAAEPAAEPSAQQPPPPADDSHHHRHRHGHHRHREGSGDDRHAERSRDSSSRHHRSRREDASDWINDSLDRRLSNVGGPPPPPSASSSGELLPDAKERMGWMRSGDARSDEAPLEGHRGRPTASLVLPPASRTGHAHAASEAALVESPLLAQEQNLGAAAVTATLSTAPSWRQRTRERVAASAAPAPPASLPAPAAAVSGDGSALDASAVREDDEEPLVAEMPRAVTASAALVARVSWRNAAAAQVHVPALLAGALRQRVNDSDAAAPVVGMSDSAAPSASATSLPCASAPSEASVIAHAAAAAHAPGAAPPALSKASEPAPAPAVDLNKLHSAAMRAQMMGDSAKHARLMQEIEAIRAATVTAASAPTAPAPSAAATATGHKRARDDQPVEVRVVSALDAAGRPIRSLSTGQPAVLAREDMRSGRRAGKLTGHTNLHAADALTERQAWTRGDAREQSLAELVRAEADTPAGALDATLARHITRAGAGWKHNKALMGSRAGFDEDDDGATDDLAKLAEHPDARLTDAARQKKDLQRAAAADRRHDSATASCSDCLDSTAMRKHRIISLGEYTYLAIPPGCGRLPGQLRIVPVPHISAMTDADEEVRVG